MAYIRKLSGTFFLQSILRKKIVDDEIPPVKELDAYCQDNIQDSQCHSQNLLHVIICHVLVNIINNKSNLFGHRNFACELANQLRNPFLEIFILYSLVLCVISSIILLLLFIFYF